jgi:DNA topoisomerase-1
MQAETGWAVERALRHEESDEPVAPFTTSTLLVDAEQVLGFSLAKSVQAALVLYEAGLVTYPLTTRIAVSPEAEQAARDAAAKLFGEGHVSAGPLLIAGKIHSQAELEAIRPVDPFHLPDEVTAAEVGQDAAALYVLIWKRFMASVMKPARWEMTLVTIRPTWTGSAEPLEEAQTYPHPITFRARLRCPTEEWYPGIYPTANEDTGGDQAVELADVEPGDALTFIQIESRPQAATVLPRLTPADLSDVLAAMRIGRPSSRAGAPEQLVALGWAAVERGELVSTPRGEDALYLYVEHFEDVFDLKTIQQLDRDLDRVAEGRAERVRTTAIFFFTKIAPALEEARRAAHDPVEADPLSEAPGADSRKESSQ